MNEYTRALLLGVVLTTMHCVCLERHIARALISKPRRTLSKPAAVELHGINVRHKRDASKEKLQGSAFIRQCFLDRQKLGLHF